MIVLYYTLLIINIFISLYLINIEFHRKSPFILLSVFTLIIFFIPSLLDYNIGYYAGPVYVHSFIVENITLVYSQIYAFYYLSIYLILIFFFRGYKNSNYKFPNLNTFKKTRFLRLFFILFTMSFVAFLYIRFYGSGHNFASFRNDTPFIAKVMFFYLQLSLIGMSYYYVIANKKIIAIIFSVYVFISFLYTGGSRQGASMLLIVGFTLFIYIKNRSVIYFYTAIFFGSFGLTFLKVLVYIRYVEGGFVERFEAIKNINLETLNLYNSENSLRFVYYYFLQNNANFEGFHSLKYLGRSLLFWLPSKYSLGIKPSDFEYDMFNAYVITETGGSMHPVFFGAIYSDAGILGFLWVFFVFIVSYAYSKIFNKLDILLSFSLFGLLCYSATMFARGSFYGNIVLLFYFTILYYGLSIVIKK